VNGVVHRANIDRIPDLVGLALALGASRIEIAHVQYYGWALKNRAALMPSRDQVERAATAVAELRARHHGRIVIDAVVPDYYARYPSRASAVGAVVPSMSRQRARCCPVTPPSRLPALNSGTCASVRSPISGRIPRPSTPSAAPHG
jgi:MoaA/NifB/PqqE/SkfB family radical SAM enzyme